MGLVLSGEVPARGGALDEALEAVLSNSFDLVTMLRQPRWGLNIGAGMPSTLNPLLLMHERLARSVELLLLVRTRAAPMLPPEIWALVVQQVLSIPCDNGGGGNGDHSSGSDGGGGGSGGLRLSSGSVHSLWDEGSACGGRRPVLRHYGFGSDGTLRLALDPPLHLPHLKRFRACVAAALDAVLSRGPIELEMGRGGAWGGSTWGGSTWRDRPIHRAPIALRGRLCAHPHWGRSLARSRCRDGSGGHRVVIHTIQSRERRATVGGAFPLERGWTCVSIVPPHVRNIGYRGAARVVL